SGLTETNFVLSGAGVEQSGTPAESKHPYPGTTAAATSAEITLSSTIFEFARQEFWLLQIQRVDLMRTGVSHGEHAPIRSDTRPRSPNAAEALQPTPGKEAFRLGFSQLQLMHRGFGG